MKEELDLSAMGSSPPDGPSELGLRTYTQLPWSDETVTRFWLWQARRPSE